MQRVRATVPQRRPPIGRPGVTSHGGSGCDWRRGALCRGLRSPPSVTSYGGGGCDWLRGAARRAAARFGAPYRLCSGRRGGGGRLLCEVRSGGLGLVRLVPLPAVIAGAQLIWLWGRSAGTRHGYGGGTSSSVGETLQARGRFRTLVIISGEVYVCDRRHKPG